MTYKEWNTYVGSLNPKSNEAHDRRVDMEIMLGDWQLDRDNEYRCGWHELRTIAMKLMVDK